MAKLFWQARSQNSDPAPVAVCCNFPAKLMSSIVVPDFVKADFSVAQAMIAVIA
jgi:hypothetical protein